MKKWLLPKIVASIALAGILIGVLWTAVLYIFSAKQETEIDNTQEMQLSPEQMDKLREITWSGADLDLE